MLFRSDELRLRGYGYNSQLTNRAQDIFFDNPEELCESLGFILNHIVRFDFEIPANYNPSIGYPIANGTTSGGNPMKYGKEYRIYFDTVYNMPPKLRSRLQDDDQNRITGSFFVEACYYLGFRPGSYQNKSQIQSNILSIFSSSSEQAAFANGLRL